MTRLIHAEILKLRRRRGLMAWSAVIVLGAVALIFGVQAIHHASDTAHTSAAGGKHHFDNATFFLAQMVAVAAIMVGATVGAADRSAGVFRDLVSTGVPRWRLFAARVPAVLVVLVPLAVLGAVETGALATLLKGGAVAPGAGDIVKAAGWLALDAVFMGVLALGLASVLGTTGTTIGLLLGWQLAASRILVTIDFLGSLRDLVPLGAFERLAPTDPTLPQMPVAVAVVVIAGWIAAALAAGAWRTARVEA